MSFYEEDSPEPGSSESCSEYWNAENIPPIQRREPRDGFDWRDFFDEFGGHPSFATCLWPHHAAMEQQIFDALFAKDLMLFVEKNGTVRLATVVLSLGMECSVEYQDVSYNDGDWVTLNEIITEPIRAKQLRDEIQKKVKVRLNFVNMDDVHMYRPILDQELQTLIKPGQYFELQNEANPRLFSIAKVLENYCGIIVYILIVVEEGKQQVNTIHIRDKRCYPLGWVSNHPEEYYFELTPTSTDGITELEENRVPSICFNGLTKEYHSFQVGNLIEVMDENTGLFTYPGHISELYCPRFVIADIYTNKRVEPVKMLISKYTEGIYPKEFSHQNKLQMQHPMVFSANEQSFSWSEFKNLIRQPKAVTAAETSLHKPNLTKIHCQQYIEYFNYDLCMMTPALIVRSKLDSVWLITGLNKTTAQSIHAFIGKPAIFPVGFAKKYKIPFCISPDVPYTIPNGQDPMGLFEESGIGGVIIPGTRHNRFFLEKYFKPIPAPVFRKPQYCGRGRPEKSWHFMTEWSLKDNWLPQVLIVRTCRLGSWLDPKLFANLSDLFSYGSVPDVIDTIVKEFFRCTKPEFRNEVVAALDVSDPSIICPKQVVKFRWKAEGWIMTIVACESCEAYPGWLRNFLSCYGCCPNLLAVKHEQRDVPPCREGCDTVDPVLNPVFHNGRRSKEFGDFIRRRGKRDVFRLGRAGQNLTGNSEQSAQLRTQRLPGALDLPEYATWHKEKLRNYLIEHNPTIKVLLRNFFQKSGSANEVLQCRDIMAISRYGYTPRDATRIFEALEVGFLAKMIKLLSEFALHL